MPLQLISILTFIFFLLPPPFSTGLIAKPGCPDQCGNLSIPYPFGIGPKCSLEPSFTIRCSGTVPPKPYLSIIDKELLEINETYIRVKYPNLVSACYDLSGKSYKYSSMSVNLSGSPYTLSYRNRVTAIGCDDAVLQYNRSLVTGGCSAFCAEKNDTGGVGYCPNNAASLGNGCCQSNIRGTDFVRAELMDLSKKSQRRKLFPCSYAFIQEEESVNATIFSYPLYYLDNLTALLNDNWESSTRSPVVRLDWTIRAKNCSTARLNIATYACVGEKSVCVDSADEFLLIGRGYQCRCVQGYEGNPYLLGGCKPISFSSSSSIAKYGCTDQCGKLSIPFPFGVGENCYLEPSFEIICNGSTNPPKAYLRVLNAEIIRFITNSSQVWVNYPNLGLACYNWSDAHRRISKTVERSLIIDLLRTQYTLSDDSWITVIGYDDMVVGIIGQANKSFIGSICAAVCLDNQLYTYDDGEYYVDCPYGSTAYMPGYGCCRAPIPRGTSHLEAYLSDLSGRWPRTNFSCSYAFVGKKEQDYQDYPILNNSTAIPPDGPILERNWRQTTLPLDWRIGAVNCKEAQQNLGTYACKDNSDCVDFDATIRGYLCNCSKGYQGNPYLSPGCQG